MSVISLDLKSRNRGLAEWNERRNPSTKQLNQIFQACTLVIDQLGEIVKFLEVIKVSFYQYYSSSYLQVTLRAILIDPRSVKFEASYEANIDGDVNEVEVKLIASSLVKQIKEMIRRQVKLTQQSYKKMQALIKPVE